MTTEEEDTRIYQVVMNHEEQYSIRLAERPLPTGWHAVGKEGPKSECLADIEEVWIDMRPLSLRNSMAAQAQDKAALQANSVRVPFRLVSFLSAEQRSLRLHVHHTT